MRVLVALALLGGCTGSADDTGGGAVECDDPALTWDNWGAGFFRNYCTSCHSSTSPDRNGAPESLDFDTEERVAEQASLIRSAVLDRGSMPIGGGVFDNDLIYLDQYLACSFGQ